MVTQITRGIKVSIKTSFEGTYYKESKLHYAFEYIVKIENQSKELVQLNSRHWNILDSLNDDGVMLVNILDPKVKGKRYYSGDALVDMLKDNFLGQVGMRITQRPQGAAVFKDADGNFDKEAMDAFMKKVYIENIWCFSKNKNKDIFKQTKEINLEDFV